MVYCLPMDIWRTPAEESTDLYPGLVLADDRVTGSITIGRTRLPLWAVISEVIRKGWDFVEEEYYPDLDSDNINFGESTPEENRARCIQEYYSFNAEKAAEFFYNLLEQRGELGRLVLLLADVERMSTFQRHWTETKKHRQRMIKQLRRCLEILEEAEE